MQPGLREDENPGLQNAQQPGQMVLHLWSSGDSHPCVSLHTSLFPSLALQVRSLCFSMHMASRGCPVVNLISGYH